MKEFNKKFYEYHFKKFGKEDIRGMGWHEEDEYSIRFDVVAKIADLNSSSILDVGCGFGGLYGWLVANHIKNFNYLGVDILEEMVQVAKEKHPTGVFKKLDILEDEVKQFDYVFCIGTLNVGEDDEFFFSMIKKMISIAKKGVALSFLSEKKYLVKGPYYFGNPSKVIEIAKELNCNVKIANDKRLMGESILFIYKD